MQQYYWNLNLSDYSNLGGDFPITKFFLFLIVFICAGEIYFALEKRLVSRFLRRLLSRNAIGKENAKTLDELSFANDKSIVRLLTSTSGRLRDRFEIYGLVKPTPEEYLEAEKERRKNHRKKELPDLSSVKVAIDPEKEKEIRSYLFRNSPSGLRIALTCLLTLSIGLCLIFFLPTILDLLDYLIGSVTG